MSEASNVLPEGFGASFQGFLEKVASETPKEEPFFVKRLRDHFGVAPAKLPIVSEELDACERPNVHVAIDAWLEGPGRSSELLGIVAAELGYMDVKLSQLIAPPGGGLMKGPVPTEGPVQYTSFTLADDKVLACVQRGLYLMKEGEQRLAVFVRGVAEMGFQKKFHVEVMGPDRERAERFLADLRKAMRARNVYRGQVVSLSTDHFGSLEVKFHTLPKIAREQIILPDGLLDRVERQTLGFSKHAERLKAAGRHLKRGILLHGKPGTGKTLTAMYLASRMRERTSLLMTGRGMGLLERSCTLARLLQPAMVILEDVDLVAEDRSTQTCGQPLLFELLNQMDGLAEDADVIFLLTTNRPDVLEPALASRPGRIDLALEVPLPDAGCRRRLYEFYGRGLTLALEDMDSAVSRTEGASAAFIRELVRKAALYAADEAPGEIAVHDRHVNEALRELTLLGGELTKSLLGFGTSKR